MRFITCILDDPFAAALNSSAKERRRDAWLPSESTNAILISCLTNQVAPEIGLDKTTRPGLSTSELLGKNSSSQVNSHLGVGWLP